MLAKEFKTSVLPLSNKLLHFSNQLIKNEDEARDVVQDIFLKLWQKKENLKKIENIEAYAMRMARNRCLDLLRTKRAVSIEEQTGTRKEETGDLNVELELSETALLIKKIICKLPELQRRIIQLRDIDQLDYDEIEQLTGLKVNAIRVNLSRARKTVRDELFKQHGYGIENDQTNTAKIF
jgi:RNA polymerase sigma-70 factor (ECF subfamily)